MVEKSNAESGSGIFCKLNLPIFIQVYYKM